MFLVAKAASSNDERLAMILMRGDGLFEGRIYHKREKAWGSRHILHVWSDDYEVCATTETLSRAETIVYEELGL